MVRLRPSLRIIQVPVSDTLPFPADPLEPIILDTHDATRWACRAEEDGGDGHIIWRYDASVLPLSCYRGSTNLLQNIYDYLKLAPVIWVTALVTPESGCGLGVETIITVEVTNFDLPTVSTFPIKYQGGWRYYRISLRHPDH